MNKQRQGCRPVPGVAVRGIVAAVLISFLCHSGQATAADAVPGLPPGVSGPLESQLVPSLSSPSATPRATETAEPGTLPTLPNLGLPPLVSTTVPASPTTTVPEPIQGVLRHIGSCGPLTTEERNNILLKAWLAGLDPNSDDDGDGFTNGQELGPLAFDPIADPTRFNPLIADVPRIEASDKGDIAIALLDSVSEGKQLGTVRISETERKSTDVDRQTKATMESHQFGIGIEGGGGKDKEGGTRSIKGTVQYNYTRATTNERTIEIGEETRQLNRQELSDMLSSGSQVDGGTLAVTFGLKNTGNVAFRIESANLIVRERLQDGTLAAFGILRPDFEFGKGPTLGPGEEKDILFEMGGIGATDALELVQDLSALEIDVGALELSQIAVGAMQVGAGNFAQYQTSVRQNTAQVTIDYGPNESETHFVSTTFSRDVTGRPLGISLCDAVQVLLARELTVRAEPVEIRGKRYWIHSVARPGPSGTPPATDKQKNVYWMLHPDDNRHPGDVQLRAAEAIQLTLFKDQDRDELEHRDENREGTSEETADSDGDGLTDFYEVANTEQCKNRASQDALCGPFRVTVVDEAGQPVVTGHDDAGTTNAGYEVRRTDPTCADSDKDGLTDRYEKQRSKEVDLERGLDPWLTDTDNDGVLDGGPGRAFYEERKCHAVEDKNGNGIAVQLDTDGNNIPDRGDPWTSPAGLTARFYDWPPETGWTPDPRRVDQKEFILSRIDKGSAVGGNTKNLGFSFDFDANSTRSPAPDVNHDHFLILWTGFITVPADGLYQFGAQADDGLQLSLSVNGEWKTVVDRWERGTASVYGFGDEIELQPERKIPVELWYYEGVGSAKFELGYRYRSSETTDPSKFTTVPQAWLSPDPAVPIRGRLGLTARYYFDAEKRGLDALRDGNLPPILARIEERLSWAWSNEESPLRKSVPWDYFIGHWTGWVTLPKDSPAGEYEFGGRHDDSMQILIDGREVYRRDSWVHSPQWGSAVTLTPGKRLKVEVLFWEKDGPALAELHVRPVADRNNSRIVPAEWLSPDLTVTPFAGQVPEEKWVYLGNPGNNAYSAFMVANGGGMSHCDTGDVPLPGMWGPAKSWCQIPDTAFHIEIKVHQINAGAGNPQIGDTIVLPRTPRNDVCIMLTGTVSNPSYTRTENWNCGNMVSMGPRSPGA